MPDEKQVLKTLLQNMSKVKEKAKRESEQAQANQPQNSQEQATGTTQRNG